LDDSRPDELRNGDMRRQRRYAAWDEWSGPAESASVTIESVSSTYGWVVRQTVRASIVQPERGCRARSGSLNLRWSHQMLAAEVIQFQMAVSGAMQRDSCAVDGLVAIAPGDVISSPAADTMTRPAVPSPPGESAGQYTQSPSDIAYCEPFHTEPRRTDIVGRADASSYAASRSLPEPALEAQQQKERQGAIGRHSKDQISSGSGLGDV
jgi:hypothetical protein